MKLFARWLIAVLLFLASLWFGFYAAGNAWAAGSTPTIHKEAYASRASSLFLLSLLCVLASVATAVLNVRAHLRRKRERASSKS